MNKNITELPDYSTLKKLAAALWQQDHAYHGAAIMVGAGFSRSAASTGDINKKLPLWHDLSKIIAEELGTYSSIDPLRLAEEYNSFFGKQALHDLIKKSINDVAWTPGALHKTMLELPWSEVLTTNWDTLLERASIEIHNPVYNVVSRQEDLSSARSPRIVKLHGTANVTEDLVFTQEDYRKYPQRHAAFVNFVRQTFIENELCLIGFSGDDPNFLQWAGWVRDHLATHARRIYLVGVLNLTAAKRKYLESINIAPIDLVDIVTDYDDHDAKHLEATKIFLKTLQDLKPAEICEWTPTKIDTLEAMKKDRESYPGWLVCPYGPRWQLQQQLNGLNFHPLSELTSEVRAKLLYEIAWRHGLTYKAIPSGLAQNLLTICDPDKPCILPKKQQMEVALLLLKNTRWFDDVESRTIEEKTKAILENNVKYWPESIDELLFHQAILARDALDYSALEKIVEKITHRDCVWKMRKASLLAELGRFDEGEMLIAEAHRELLGQYRNDRNSIYVFSRLAWAHWFLRAIETMKPGKPIKPFPSSYQDSKCSPWDHIEHIQKRISKAVEKQQKQQEIEPSFEPGRYKDNSYQVSYSNELHPLLLIEGISSTVGMPLRWDGVSFLVEPASRLAGLNEINVFHRFALAIRSADSDKSDVLNKVFSRIQVACLRQDESDYLMNSCMHAIDYWNSILSNGKKEIRNYAINSLRVFIEVLARASVRATPEQAKQIFRLVCELCKKSTMHHFWLFDAVKHLIENTLKSIPESQHHEILLEALSFPLQNEISINNHQEWANPVIGFPGSRVQNVAINRRIDEIIDKIAPCSTQSAPALLRLLPLHENGFLTEAECQKISGKVWGSPPEYKDLPETGLPRHALLYFPAQDSSAVKSLVRHYLFGAEGENLFNPSLLKDLANVAQSKSIKELPSEDQAISYFKRLVAWRPPKRDKDPFRFFYQEDKQLGELIGDAIAQSIVPALNSNVLTEENFQELWDFYAEVQAPKTIIAFSYFAAANDLFVERVERLIRQELQKQDSRKTAFSSYAILKWRELDDSTAIARLISRLVYLIGSNRVIGLPALLWSANQMYKKGYLSDVEIDSLIEILPIIFDNTNYRNISPSSKESVSVSLVRSACVSLAKVIESKGKKNQEELLRVLEEARQDALPEVRFAEMNDK